MFKNALKSVADPQQDTVLSSVVGAADAAVSTNKKIFFQNYNRYIWSIKAKFGQIRQKNKIWAKLRQNLAKIEAKLGQKRLDLTKFD